MQMREATATGDDARRMKLWQQMSDTWKKYNCSPVKSIYGVAVVLPLFFSFYRALRSMADHAELWPGFTTGGLFWCQNLALPDPYYVLPVLTGLSMIASFEVYGMVDVANVCVGRSGWHQHCSNGWQNGQCFPYYGCWICCIFLLHACGMQRC